jgi:hypothetical protein
MDKAPELSKLTWLELAALCESLYKENRELERQVGSLSWLQEANLDMKDENLKLRRRNEKLKSLVKGLDRKLRHYREAVDNRK